jgi:hypothetical protein
MIVRAGREHARIPRVPHHRVHAPRAVASEGLQQLARLAVPDVHARVLGAASDKFIVYTAVAAAQAVQDLLLSAELSG